MDDISQALINLRYAQAQERRIKRLEKELQQVLTTMKEAQTKLGGYQ